MAAERQEMFRFCGGVGNVSLAFPENDSYRIAHHMLIAGCWLVTLIIATYAC